MNSWEHLSIDFIHSVESGGYKREEKFPFAYAHANQCQNFKLPGKSCTTILPHKGPLFDDNRLVGNLTRDTPVFWLVNGAYYLGYDLYNNDALFNRC